MINLLLLFICLAIGVFLRRLKGFSEDASTVLNTIIIYVCLPAITLLNTTEIHFSSNLLLPILMPYIIYVGSFIFFNLVAPLINIDSNTKGALILTAGISSISFVGFPIFEVLFGKVGLQYGILMSQAGSFVVCGTLGIFTASYYSSADFSMKNVALNIFKFPPFLAFCVALILNISNYHFPVWGQQILDKIGSPFSFLALLSIGLQINFQRSQLDLKALFYGLFYKLLLAPLLIFTIYILILGEYSPLGKLCVIGATLGSMNTATIIAITYKLNPNLATQMVSISIPLSLLNVAIWYGLMLYF